MQLTRSGASPEHPDARQQENGPFPGLARLEALRGLRRDALQYRAASRPDAQG